MIEQIDDKKRRVKFADLLAGLTLLFSVLLFFYDLFTGKYILTERDLGVYFIPPRFFWVESIKNLDFPLWNPYQFSGSPFLANPQHGVLSPLNVFFFVLPFDTAFNVIILLHFFLGGLFVYLFLRDLDAEPSCALLSGLVFMLGGFLLSVHGLLSVLLSVVWTPLVLLFFRRTIAGQGLKNEALTALFMTLSFLGGGIEIVYGNFLVLLLLVICYPFSKGSFIENGSRPGQFTERVFKCLGRGSELFARFKSLVVVSVLFLMLSAIQLIPFLRALFSFDPGEWPFLPGGHHLEFRSQRYFVVLSSRCLWIFPRYEKVLDRPVLVQDPLYGWFAFSPQPVFFSLWKKSEAFSGSDGLFHLFGSRELQSPLPFRL